MKNAVIFAIFLFALSGCATNEMHDSLDHIGCQENEISVDGECFPAEENNMMIFGKDFSDSVITEEISGDIYGFLARPKDEGNYPGVIMIHEWWGLNENIKEMAKILANEGYVVFAIDLYDGEVAEDSSKAGELAGVVRNNPEAAIEKMKKAVRYLKEEQNAKKVGSLGWCFGGQQSLQISLNEELDATVIYYGSLTDDKNELGNIEWPVLGIFGEEDSGIPVDSVRGFESALNDLGVENDIYIYPGVGHAFANPSGSNYAGEETLDAWEKTVDFLNENLKG